MNYGQTTRYNSPKEENHLVGQCCRTIIELGEGHKIGTLQNRYDKKYFTKFVFEHLNDAENRCLKFVGQ